MSNVPPDELIVPEERRSKYDLDTRILLTAIFCLLFVVALVTFLHLYTRYVLRRHRAAHRATTISLFRVGVATAGPHEELPKVGLDPSAITALPMFPYRRTNNASNGKHDGSSAACAICLSVIEEGEIVRLLPSCTHVFHVGCIDMWLSSNSTCPVCRAGVEPPPMAVAVETGESSAPPPGIRELSGGGVTEGTSETKEGGLKDGGSISSRFSSSFRRMYMLSTERSAGRRTQGDHEVEDLERQ
ncbi:E3 ubiquitin-protein ligase ATL41-like [Phoenix dactylifera]|uniref:RING-type E3 ubiquitin transferase n=1 Tax=Phoenix dactylifera TaxID=42345 RepID=A0A8B7C2A0_PHODC|nr:E3 ubiquitin-protein ligase ATL41-like [Phoenix dactylifera]